MSACLPNFALRVLPSARACLAALLVLALATPALAREPSYLKPDAVDLARLLPPPPADHSEKGRQDLKYVLELQDARSEEAVAVANADVERHLHRYSGAMGTDLSAERAPLANALLDRAWKEAKVINDNAKARFKRRRPYDLDQRVKPAVPTEKSGSYPSGHAAYGVFAATILANMVPERATHLYARGHEFGFGRLIGGVHYPTDVEAGRVAGTVLAAFVLANPAFQADLAKAAAEVRALLSLPPLPAPENAAAPAVTDDKPASAAQEEAPRATSAALPSGEGAKAVAPAPAR